MLLEAPAEEGPMGEAHVLAEERAREYQEKLEDEHDIDGMKLWFSRIYVPDWRKLATVFETFEATVKDL